MEERVCTVCGSTDKRGQWYSGPMCKPCHRKWHREAHRLEYQQKDRESYEKRKPRVLARAKEYYQANSDRIKARTKAHREAVGDQRRDGYFEEYRDTHREHMNAYSRQWADQNREKCRAAWTKYNKTHAQYRAFMTAKRRAAKLRATPPWLTQEHWDEIARIYAECPIGYDVDHIVPLQGKNVSGLHVPWNLAAIPSTDNRKKNNKF